MIPNTELSDLLDLGNLSSSAERLLERTKLVFVPYQWTRVCSEEDSLIKESSSRTITYTTPSGRVLRSADDVKKLLIKIKDPTAKICQCYLDSNLTFEEVFNFDSRVASLCLPPPETDADSGIVLKATKCLGASEVDLPKLDRIQDLFDHLIKLEHVDLSLDESHSSYASTMTSTLEPANVMDDLLCSKPVNNRYVMLNGQRYSRHLTESSLAHLCYEFEDLEQYLVSLLPEIHVQIPKLLTSTPVRPLPSPLPIPQEDSEKKSSNGIEQNGDHDVDEEADDTILEPEDHEHQNDSRPSTPRTDDDTKGAAATKGVESKDSNENDDLKSETPKSGRSSLDSSLSPFSLTKKKITFEDCDEVELVKKEDAVESDSTDIEEKVEKEVEVKKNKKKDSNGITVKQPQNGDYDDESVILEQNPEDHEEDDHIFDPSMLVDVQLIEEKVPDSKVLTTTIEQSTSGTSPSPSASKFGRTLRGRRYPAKVPAAGSSNFESNSEDSNTNDLKGPKRSRRSRARDIVPPIASTSTSSSKKNNKKVVEVEEEVEDVKKKEEEVPEDSDSTDIEEEVMEVESQNLNTAKGPNPVTKRKKRKRIVMQTSYKKKKTSTGASETVRKSTGSESTRKSTTGGPTHKKPINPANGTWVCPYLDCARVFDQRSNLQAHKRIHIREKPYECAWGNGCDYASEFRNNTTRHISEMHLGRSTRYERRSRGGGIEVEDNRNPSDFVRVVEVD